MREVPSSVERVVRVFRSQLAGENWKEEVEDPVSVLVAVSGGVDSLVLLHLLRFTDGLPPMVLRAAHFDHGMRPESGEDARWVQGLCMGWQVPLHLGRVQAAPTSEEEARERRYAFLLDVKEETNARWLLTAHHADDQAETVLFRIFRGTGLAGLAGIPRRRSPGVLRPLLPLPRQALEDYASFHRIRPRPDPSNQDLSIPRNLLRHRILPQVERGVANGARKALRRLAQLARENERAWESLLPKIVNELAKEEDRGTVVSRPALLAYHPAVRARVLRHLLRRRGVTLSESGTRGLLEFTRGGASGRTLHLPGGLCFRREFDTFLLEAHQIPGEDEALELQDAGPGEGKVILGGKRMVVEWGKTLKDEGEGALSLDPATVPFPLRVRGWVPGDRISLPHGGKKLKKLFGDAGVPLGARNRIPVLVDAEERVLWVVGVAVSTRISSSRPQGRLCIRIQEADDS
jgi:tRNA(Ile)-lysidine synthase